MGKPRDITLLTDFGTVDGYVASMKGVLASLAPHVRLHDATHAIPHGDIDSAARALARFWRVWPEGTVHLVVVDPGVGTDRRALAIEAEGRWFVGPDNGVATPVLSAGPWRAVLLDPIDPPASRTFHGRDLFAPMAARLARGDRLETLGPPVYDPVQLEWESAAGGRGRVVAIDRFGNLITNIPAGPLTHGSRVFLGDLIVPVLPTYGSAPVGSVLALVNSEGVVEIAVREGSAAERLGIGVGIPVTVSSRGSGATT